MACAPDWVTAYVDGELDEESQRLMESHVASCWRCSDQVRGERMVRLRLRALPEPETPVTLALRFPQHRAWLN
ncbi:MAG TPA: zf-HC2 domain-containing protein [Vicinamibacteria bacterium]|nr:zf-HC2 domain-containing protein [Vicinamibacteria bacterium]